MLDGKRLIVGICGREGGQLWYRLETPLRVLEEAGVASCPILALTEDGTEAVEGLPDLLHHADLVIWQNPAGPLPLKWIRTIRSAGIPVVSDLDDFNIGVTPESESYIWWGRKKRIRVTDPDGGNLYYWKHGAKYGEATYDVERNRMMLRTQLECLRASTAVTCATFHLKLVTDRYKGWRLNRPSFLLPNMVDSRKWPSIGTCRPRPTVRMLWQGGTSHLGDLYELREYVKPVLTMCPEARLVILGGPDAKTYLNGLPKHQVEVHEGVKGEEAYIAKLVELDCDIGLAPLRDTLFNRCKSAVKFLQYTMLGIPTIASAIPPYSDVIEMEEGDGQDWTGLLAEDPATWVDGLAMLVRSPEMRFTLARNARNWVRWHGDSQAPHVLGELCGLYGGICGLSDDVPAARDTVGPRRI